MALQALLFDVDGTLADTESLGHLPAYNRAFRELGLAWRWSSRLYRKLLLLPTGRERLRHYLSEYRPPLGCEGGRTPRDPDALVREVHASKARHFEDLVARGKVPLRPGVRRLMEEALDESVAIAIVTNASRATLKSFLAHTLGDELSRAVHAIVGGDQVARKKPAPDLYFKALRMLDLPADACIAVEDSALGLHAARGAGLRTLVTVNDYTSDQAFPEAVLVVSGLGEPNAPFEVIDGDAGAHRWVSVDLLRMLSGRPLPPQGRSQSTDVGSRLG